MWVKTCRWKGGKTWRRKQIRNNFHETFRETLDVHWHEMGQTPSWVRGPPATSLDVEALAQYTLVDVFCRFL